jgi:hypothetical protein
MTQRIDPFDKYEAGAKVADDSAYAVSGDQASQECADFQALMPKRIGAGEDLQTFPHMLTCERCRALVRDLEYIAEVARQLIPIEEEPRDELWAQIQLAIERGEA